MQLVIWNSIMTLPQQREINFSRIDMLSLLDLPNVWLSRCDELSITYWFCVTFRFEARMRRISPRGESLLKAASRPGRIKHDIYGSTDYNHSHYRPVHVGWAYPSGPQIITLFFWRTVCPHGKSWSHTCDCRGHRLGVSIHTVFMGRNDFPQILHKCHWMGGTDFHMPVSTRWLRSHAIGSAHTHRHAERNVRT